MGMVARDSKLLFTAIVPRDDEYEKAIVVVGYHSHVYDAKYDFSKPDTNLCPVFNMRSTSDGGTQRILICPDCIADLGQIVQHLNLLPTTPTGNACHT